MPIQGLSLNNGQQRDEHEKQRDQPFFPLKKKHEAEHQKQPEKSGLGSGKHHGQDVDPQGAGRKEGAVFDQQ